VWKTRQRLKIGIHRFTLSGQLEQNRLVLAIALISPEPGDPSSQRVGSIGSAPLGDLGVEGSEILVF
jgi:hypothetical protein